MEIEFIDVKFERIRYHFISDISDISEKQVSRFYH